MVTNQDIGRRMATRRAELGLTLDDVARRVGVAKSTIQRYEKGQIVRLKKPVVETIAGALNVTAAWLLGEVDTPPSDPDEALKAAFWHGDRDLPQEDLDALWADVREYAAFKAQQRRRQRFGE